MRQLYGQIEQLTIQMGQLSAQLQRIQQDSEFRLEQLEGGGQKASGAGAEAGRRAAEKSPVLRRMPAAARKSSARQSISARTDGRPRSAGGQRRQRDDRRRHPDGARPETSGHAVRHGDRRQPADADTARRRGRRHAIGADAARLRPIAAAGAGRNRFAGRSQHRRRRSAGGALRAVLRKSPAQTLRRRRGGISHLCRAATAITSLLETPNIGLAKPTTRSPTTSRRRRLFSPATKAIRKGARRPTAF